MRTIHQPESRTVPEQPTAVVRATLRHGALGDWFGTAFDQVAGLRTGDPWEIYHDPPRRDPQSWRTEVIQPFALAPAEVGAGRP